MTTLVELKGEFTLNESLKMLNSWHVGGPAKAIYRPSCLFDLSQFLQKMPDDEPIVWLGLGSNVLIRDGGINATVILTQGLLNEMYLLSENLLRVEAGVTCAKVAKFSTKNALKDAAFMAGIPGTMGGALAMNAGAFGGETWNIVSKVETINRSGQISVRDAASFEVGYRSVKMPAETWFVAAHLQLTPGDTAVLAQDIKTLLAKRALTQPIGLPSCGSVFRNPPGDHAARLIESIGLKGYTIGGAQVSPKHANFIINTGTATSEDIEALIYWVEAQVLEKTGVALIREVKIIGER